MRKKSLPAFALALAFTAVALPGPAGAQLTIKDSSVHTDRPVKFDITGSLGFFGDRSVGTAAWVSIPLLPDGFIPPLNDSFGLEFGMAVNYAWANYGFGCDYNYFSLVPLGGVRWDFHLTEAWTVFGKAKLGIGHDFASVECGGTKIDDVGGNHLASDFGVGAFWNFSPGMGMRFDLGYQGASVGLSFNF
jgi:hypothetical protein